MCKVSIIVPNYNHAKYLSQRLDSIFSQTYQNFEVIILDDFSTDNSLEILEQYRNHPKVKAVVFNEKNSGSPFKQWDKGINLAAGEFIWIAESDDWCEPTLLETLVNGLLVNAATVLGFVQSYLISGINSVTWISKQDELEKNVNGIEYIKSYLLYGNTIYNASMAIFKKSAYSKIGIEYRNYKFCGDWLFWVEIASQGDVFISGRILNYFRKHDEDISGKAYDTGLNFVEELQVLFNLADKKLINESELWRAVNLKHIEFRSSKKKFSFKRTLEIESLFYVDKHTRLFKFQLIWNYRKWIFKQKFQGILKRIFF